MPQLQMSNLRSLPWLEVGFIVLFGAFGGFLSWLFAITVGEPMKMSAAGAIPASILLGSGASFIGVYVIANSDTKGNQAFFRCLGFALLCGFAWKPVFDAGSALIRQKASDKQFAQLTQEAQRDLTQTLADTTDSLVLKTAFEGVERVAHMVDIQGKGELAAEARLGSAKAFLNSVQFGDDFTTGNGEMFLTLIPDIKNSVLQAKETYIELGNDTALFKVDKTLDGLNALEEKSNIPG